VTVTEVINSASSVDVIIVGSILLAWKIYSVYSIPIQMNAKKLIAVCSLFLHKQSFIFVN
jgi:hypothetical protein